ncbi:hypothetical protein POM88_021545 [Heracleum sosnowskyi]|uniref:DUF4218 domain-containing protein n=1 Tax=Heracleum sosnowskyi TaxID=360622 RepID=A0AAD8IDP9_9APIA|nr:hypothetical protein POM88_021545 [Heracleum sosnowskyi]
MANNDEDEEDEEVDVDIDRVEEMIHDVEDHFIHQPNIFNNLVEDSKKLLYPGCNDQITRWHVEGRKSDGMLRHPGDSPQWRTIDGKKFPEFGADARNLRLGLCADGMNPFPDIIVTLCEFEIFLCTLKAYVRNRSRPEGSIIEGYSVEETIEFCTGYLAGVEPVGIPKSRHEGRLEGQGTLGHKMITPLAEMCDRAHLFVLQHMTEVDPYLKEHIAHIRQRYPSNSGKWVTNEHNRTFIQWFKERLLSQLTQRSSDVSNTLKWLAYGPDMPVRSYEAYDVNGKRRILGIENVEDEEEYNQFDENPPFSMGLPTSYEDETVETNYTRNDHDEGLWIDHQV